MPIAQLSSPLVRPVTLVQIKQHLRIDIETEDDLLNTYCDAATDYIEAYISQFLISRTIRQFIDKIPNTGEIDLEAGPVSQIIEVRVFDADGSPQILNAESYRFNKYSFPQRLTFDTQLPGFSNHNGLEIDLVAGFGESGADLPQNVVRAVLVLIAHWYEYRGTNASGETYSTIPDGLEKLLAPVREVRL